MVFLQKDQFRICGLKVIVDGASDMILGAHLLAPYSEEVINLFAMPMRYGLTATQLRSVVFSYPSAAYESNYMLK